MRFRKIEPRIWKDEKFITFSHIEKLIVIYCFTAQSNRIGIFNFSPGAAAEDLNISLQTFMKGFDTVCHTLSWRYNKGSRILYIPTWWKYNRPDNPKALKGFLSDIDSLPESPLISEFWQNIEYLPDTVCQTFRDGMAYRMAYRMAYKEKEKEREKEKETEKEKEAGVEGEAPSPPTAPLTFPVLTIPCKSHNGSDSQFPIYQIDIDEWQKIYSAVNVKQELMEIRDWNITNSDKRKINVREHIRRWLSKEQDKGGAQPRASPYRSRHVSDEEAARITQEVLHGDENKT